VSKPSASDLPYRPCVGVALFNHDGLVWIGRRADAPDSDSENDEGGGSWWQMPQGGIDKGEQPLAAARRELYEETSVRSARLVAAAPDEVRYDLPKRLIGRAWGGRYRGQSQHWFAMRFEGQDSEINILAPGGGHHKPEFSEWRWESLANLPRLVVGFKRPVYETVAAVFRDVTKSD
jgi:putative (di)nucleoside polyphosphate hydrolase